MKISLPEDNKTIIASEYKLYLPTEQQLIAEVEKQIQKRENDEPAGIGNAGIEYSDQHLKR